MINAGNVLFKAIVLLACQDSTRKMRRSLRFTIIELLVVMGIIAVLVSLLLPALSSARESGRKSACAGNLKQIGLAFNMYFNDFDGFVIPYQIYLGDGSHCAQWCAFLRPYFNTDVGKSYIKKPLTCPSDKSPTWVSGYNPYFYLETGLYENLGQYSTYIYHAELYRSLVRLSKTSQAGEYIMITEKGAITSRLWFWAKWSTIAECGLYNNGTYIPQSLGLRHNHTANTLYLDGHIKTAKSIEDENLFPYLP